jgi:hypothetical protein
MKVITVREFVERLIPAKSVEQCGFDANSFYTNIAQSLYNEGIAMQTHEDGYVLPLDELKAIKESIIDTIKRELKLMESWRVVAPIWHISKLLNNIEGV